MWGEIQKYLENLKYEYELYVNIPLNLENNIPTDFNWVEYVNLHEDLRRNKINTEEKSKKHYSKYGFRENRIYKNSQSEVIDHIRSFKNNAIIIMTPNKGMDIGGFLYTYRMIKDDVDLVLKIHTKKGIGDVHKPSMVLRRFGNDEAVKVGSKWFNDMMSGVLKDENQINLIIKEFKTNNKCGMVGYRKYDNYDKNLHEMNKLFPIFGISNHLINTKFVGGTIFWIRNNTLKKYLNEHTINHLLNVLPNGYAYEPSPNHAMERIFGSIVYNEKQELLVIN
jgi:hypothetical protein